jgi:hypothetical protein
MERLQTAIETASKDVVGIAEGSADLGQQSLDSYDGSRGTVSVQELQVPGEARPFRTIFLTEDSPFLYAPVVAVAMTGWVLAVTPFFMPMVLRYLDQRFRRKMRARKAAAKAEFEDLQRQKEDMKNQKEDLTVIGQLGIRKLDRTQEVEGGGDVVRKKRRRSVWVAPEQMISDGTKRYTLTARAGADLLLSKKQQAIQAKELGLTIKGTRAPRLAPKLENKLGHVLGFEDKPVGVLKKPEKLDHF